MDEMFGGSNAPELKPAARLVVPARILNSIELSLIEQSGQAVDLLLNLPSVPFVDGESGDIEGQDFEGMSLRTVLGLRSMLLTEVQEKWRRQIIIAREMGPLRPDGGPSAKDYEIACMAEGVNPWPAGVPLFV
jgi:hypothetical protein